MSASNRSSQWRPGSFTKNFSWGKPSDGLKQLHEAIRTGFAETIAPVPRKLFRERVAGLGRPDFIPLNFFLLNRVINDQSFVLVDELVYQALTRAHEPDFDALALMAFNVSFVGRWLGAEEWQQFPALWAFYYVTRRLAGDLKWDTASITADDIQHFLLSEERYTGQTSRKLATNLSYIYRYGGMSRISSSAVSKLWVDSVFLCLDRVAAELGDFEAPTNPGKLLDHLQLYNFEKLSGLESLDRQLALEPLCKLYASCGGLDRWSVDRVHERQKILIPHINQYLGSNKPWTVVDPLDPTLAKTIPEACAMLARYVAGFEDVGNPLTFNVEDYVKARTRDAVTHLRALNINPRLSAEDILNLTRN